MRRRFSKRFLRGFRFSNVVLLKRTTFEKRTTFGNLWKTSKRFLKGSRSPEVFQRFFRGFRSTFFVYFRCYGHRNTEYFLGGLSVFRHKYSVFRRIQFLEPYGKHRQLTEYIRWGRLSENSILSVQLAQIRGSLSTWDLPPQGGNGCYSILYSSSMWIMKRITFLHQRFELKEVKPKYFRHSYYNYRISISSWCY